MMMAMSMNQLNSKPAIFTRNFFLASTYWISEETLLGSAAVLMAFTSTVAAATPSMFSAVPTMVWSALKLMQATPSRAE